MAVLNPPAASSPFYFKAATIINDPVWQYGPKFSISDPANSPDPVIYAPSDVIPDGALTGFGVTSAVGGTVDVDEYAYLVMPNTNVVQGTYTVTVQDLTWTPFPGFPNPARSYTLIFNDATALTGAVLTQGGAGEAPALGTWFSSQEIALDTNTGSKGTFTCSSGLPSGLSVVTQPDGRSFKVEGTVSGVAATGLYTFTVDYNDNDTALFGDDSAVFTMRVAQYTSFPTAPSVGTPYTYTFTHSGLDATPSVVFTSSGTLPNGLTLSAGGVLSGTPTVAGTFTPTIIATGVDGIKISQVFTIVVGGGSVTIDLTPATIKTKQSTTVAIVASTSTGTNLIWDVVSTGDLPTAGPPPTSSSGEIIYVTTPASNVTITLTASCAGAAANKTCVITVTNATTYPTAINVTPAGLVTLNNSSPTEQEYNVSFTGGDAVFWSGYWTLGGSGQGSFSSSSLSLQIAGATAVVYRNPSPITTAGNNVLTFIPFYDITQVVTRNINFSSVATTLDDIDISPPGDVAGVVSPPTATNVDFTASWSTPNTGNLTWTVSEAGGWTSIGGVNPQWTHVSGVTFTAYNGAYASSHATITGQATANSTASFQVTVTQAGNGSFTKTFTFAITGGAVTLDAPAVPSQATIPELNAGISVDLTGTGFTSDYDAVIIQATPPPDTPPLVYSCVTTFNGPTSLTAAIPDSGTVGWSGGAGQVFYFAIYDRTVGDPPGTFKTDNPATTLTVISGTSPLITSLSPSSVAAGSSTFSLIASGVNFSAGGSLYWNGTSIPTSAITSTSATGSVDASLVASPGTAQVTFVNSSGVSSPNFQFTISQTGIVVTPTSFSLTRGNAFSGNMVATGAIGSVTWSLNSGIISDLGLSLNPSTGQITGTVLTGANTKTVSIKATDSVNSVGLANVTFTVGGGTLTITTSSLTNARLNQAYSQTVYCSGGISPYAWSYTGTLPDGLSFAASTSQAYTVSGTPTNALQVGQTFNVTITVTDNTGPVQTATKPLTITLAAAVSSPTIASISPTSGSLDGGTTVTLTGTNFQTGAVVQFGSNYATSVNVTGGTTITCVTPSQVTATAYTVTVTNPDGGYGTYASYTYQTTVVPSFISIDKPDGPFAGGRTIVITGTDFSGVTEVKLGSNACTGVVIDSSTQITCVTPSYGSTPTTKVDVNLLITNSAGTHTAVNAYTYRPAPEITLVTPNQGPSSGNITIYISGNNFFQKNGVKPRVIIGGIEIDAANITLVE